MCENRILSLKEQISSSDKFKVLKHTHAIIFKQKLRLLKSSLLGKEHFQNLCLQGSNRRQASMKKGETLERTVASIGNIIATTMKRALFTSQIR